MIEERQTEAYFRAEHQCVPETFLQKLSVISSRLCFVGQDSPPSIIGHQCSSSNI